MMFSEICEYLGPRLKVPTEINGYLLSLDASLYQKPKIENLILWWFYDIMIVSEICEYLENNITKNGKSNFMMILC